MTHYDFKPVKYPPAEDCQPEAIKREAKDVLCRCGMVSWATWEECSDLAFICPSDPDLRKALGAPGESEGA